MLGKALTRMASQLPAPITPDGGGSGFFDSNANLDLRSGESLQEYIRRASPMMIQRTHRDINTVRVRHGMDGKHEGVEPVQYAMDSAGAVPDVYSLNGGSPVPVNLMSWYASQGFIGYQMCAILGQHWFIDKACHMPARDAMRNGYTVERSDGAELEPKMSDEFKKWDKKFKVKAKTTEAIARNRLFGIRVVLFVVNSTDPHYYEKPFNPDGVTAGSYRGITQVDPYWITPELDQDASANPGSLHFYEPTFWRINGKRYHRSHLVVLRRNVVADVLKPTYFYGGIPLPQQLYERCYAAERTANEAPQLALSKRTTAISGVNLQAAAGNQLTFNKRIADWAYLRDNFGIKIVGKDEVINQFDTTLSDFDALIMTQFQLGCAISEVPGTKMMGTQPKGFNATGEFEEASYHEFLEGLQEHEATPVMERHHLLIVRSYICPKFKCQPFETHVVWSDLDAETAKEKAERENLEADADKKWSEAGAIDGLDIRKSLISRKGGRYQGIEEALPPGLEEQRNNPIGAMVGPDGQPLPPGAAPPGAPQPPKPGAPTPPGQQAKPPGPGQPPGMEGALRKMIARLGA